MSVVTKSRLRRRAAVVVAALALPAVAVLTAPATPASAATVIPCATRVYSTPFKQWGDTHNYYTLQGGSFESGATGWTMSGSSVVSGNEPWNVTGAGSKSLAIPPNAKAVSPSFCVDPKEPLVRFFYRSPGVAGSNLKVTVTVWRGSYTNSLQFWAYGGTAGWQVSPPVNIPNVADSNTTSTVSVTFQAVNSATATWLVDDFSVDPWKSL